MGSNIPARGRIWRLTIPLPGRGCWPKGGTCKKPRRPGLPKLPEGQAEEIVVWVVE